MSYDTKVEVVFLYGLNDEEYCIISNLIDERSFMLYEYVLFVCICIFLYQHYI